MSILPLSSRYIPQSVFQSWIFWVLIVVMVVGILLYHNLVVLKRKKRAGSPDYNRPSGHANPEGMRLYYTSKGRSGDVRYESPEANFTMYYEFGGGNCVAWIDVPKPEHWEKATGLPLSRREEVLHAIGKQVVEDQVPSGTGWYTVERDSINIYS